MSPFPPTPVRSYSLTTDSWSWPHLLRPTYHSGQRFGTCGIHSGVPLFPTHEAGIHWQMSKDPPPMPQLNPTHRPLTPVDVIDLRVSLKTRTPDIGQNPLVPCVRYNGTSDAYELADGGNVICAHRDIAVIAALLRGERYQPGFIARVMDARTPPDETIMGADEAERRRRERAEASAVAVARAREEEERQRALRAAQTASPVPPDLTLDDLLNTL